jgi:FMN phosphatase YigB (HAD superfamily)/8-oxo-dGTP pyrophosphatase MutT (NUDIX family)
MIGRNQEIMKIIFDLFGVLLSSGFESSSRKLSRLLNKPVVEIEPIYRKWEIPFDLGVFDSQEFWMKINEELNTSVDWRTLNLTVLNNYQPLPGSFELLDRYQNHFPVFLLSNTRQEWFSYLDEKFSISSHFKKVVLSCDVKKRKPDIQVFKLVLNKLGDVPENFLYLDDELPNIISAEKIGIRGTLFRNAFEAELALSSRLASSALPYSKKYAGCLLITNDGKLILQKREYVKNISNLELINTFGGVVESGELYIDCIIRELNEKLNLELLDNDLSVLVELAKPGSGEWTRCLFYVTFGIDINNISIKEGVAIELLDLKCALNNPNLTPVCRVVVENYQQKFYNI